VHRYTLCELVFFDLLVYAGNVVHSGVSDVRNIDTLIFLIVWDQCRFQKKRAGTRYVEHVFLHPTGSAGQEVHSGAFDVRNVDALFFLLGWDRYRFQKNASRHIAQHMCVCIRWDMQVMLCIVVLLRHETSTHHFSCSSGTGAVILQKAHWDTLCQTCVFASGGICGSQSILLSPGRKMLTCYFSCLGGTDTDSRKSVLRHVR
jgi:hypothetical protein